jgi:hypothetical protein
MPGSLHTCRRLRSQSHTILIRREATAWERNLDDRILAADAHDSWISRGGYRNAAGEWCCGAIDCKAHDDIATTGAGWVVGGTELIPYNEAASCGSAGLWLNALGSRHPRPEAAALAQGNLSGVLALVRCHQHSLADLADRAIRDVHQIAFTLCHHLQNPPS